MCVRERECEWIRRVIYSEPCPQSHPEGIRAYLVVGDSCEGDAFACRFDRLLSIDHPKAQLRKECSAKLFHLPPSLPPSLSFASPSLSPDSLSPPSSISLPSSFAVDISPCRLLNVPSLHCDQRN